MALYVGDDKIKRVYHGATPIKKIYYGDTLVWAALGVASGLSSTRNNTSFTPAWAAVEDADSYDLRWSTNANMSNATLVTGTTSGTAVTSLSALTTYYWQVRANEGSIEGDWSATQSVTTTGALSGLSSTRTRNSFTPSWNNIAGLAYDMRWSTNSDMTGATTVTGTNSGTAVTGLNASTTYYWEVRSKRGSTTGDWSATQSVTTQDALTAPAQGAAPSASTLSRTQMRWTATAPNNGGSAITHYLWRWRQVGSVSWRTTVTTTSRTFTRTGLTAGTQYEAQFKARNSIGDAASWSPSGTGTTTANTAPARGAAPSATGGDQQVRWDATAPNNGGSAITGYDWRWREVGAAGWTTITTVGGVLTRTGLDANTQYEAQFKATNSIGTAADWSPSGTATTDESVSESFTVPHMTVQSATASSRVGVFDFGTSGLPRITNDAINGGLNNRYFVSLAMVAPSSGLYYLRVNIGDRDSTSTSGDGQDLSSAFESGWQIAIRVGTSTWTFDHDDFSSDTTEIYQWATTDTSVQAELRALHAAMVAQNGENNFFTNTSPDASVTLSIP